MSANDIISLCILSIPTMMLSACLLRVVYQQWKMRRRYKWNSIAANRPLAYLLQEGFIMIVIYDNDRGGKSYSVRVSGEWTDVINLADGHVVNLITGEKIKVTDELVVRYGVDKSTGIL